MLVPKRRGVKKRTVQLREKIYLRVHKFADDNDYEILSVIETAIEEFLEDRADEDRRLRASPATAAKLASGGAR